MLRKLCSGKTEKKFDALMLGNYQTSYHACTSCGFVQTGEPVWLEEAYKDPINACDTGILQRNIRLREQVSTLLYHFFDPKARFLDFAGGYGIFTRLMRDVGFDFFWCDKYSENIFVKGFEYESQHPIEVLTAFEVLEHLVDPIADLEKMLSLSPNLIFTTMLLPDPMPHPQDWWYYGLEHGQHVAFYTKKSLQKLAERFGKHYYNYHELHLMTERKIPQLKLKLILKYTAKWHLFGRVQKKMTSKTLDDMKFVLSLPPGN
jgi:hypothetical protein